MNNKWTIEEDIYHCYLVVAHTCGHTQKYDFGGRRLAVAYAEFYASKKCTACTEKDDMVKILSPWHLTSSTNNGSAY